MGSTTDEPEAIEGSIHMADSNNPSSASSSSPVNAPTKRSKHSGSGRKGSLMFTPTGSSGLGANSVMSSTNIKLPHKFDMDHDKTDSFPNPSDDGIETKHTHLPNEIALNATESQPARSGGGRKGSLMFTNSGTVGLGSDRILNPMNDSEKQLEINISMQATLPQTEHSVGDSIKTADSQPLPVPVSTRNGSGRKGSLMFTNNGTVGLGSNSMMNSSPSNDADINMGSSINEVEAKGNVAVNFPNDGTDFSNDQAPITYYTLPPTELSNEERPVTYYTQPSTSTYDESGPLESQIIASPQDQPQLLSGDNFVAQLLKAELEGNRQAAAELERRGSCVVTSGGIGGLGVKGFEDNSSDEEYKSKRKAGSLPGSEDYRPLVGGFAAAAYEAAKAHHFKSKQRGLSNIKESEEDENLPRLPPPCI